MKHKKTHCYVHKGLLQYLILVQIDPIPTLFFNSMYSILPSMPRSPKWSLTFWPKFCMHFSFPHVSYIPFLSDPWVDHPNIICWMITFPGNYPDSSNASDLSGGNLIQGILQYCLNLYQCVHVFFVILQVNYTKILFATGFEVISIHRVWRLSLNFFWLDSKKFVWELANGRSPLKKSK
jgi:hypothetical protein